MQGTTNVIILPKYFESMFGDADQLINMKLRLRDEPDNPVRACGRHARHDTSWHQHDMPNSSFHGMDPCPQPFTMHDPITPSIPNCINDPYPIRQHTTTRLHGAR